MRSAVVIVLTGLLGIVGATPAGAAPDSLQAPAPPAVDRIRPADTLDWGSCRGFRGAGDGQCARLQVPMDPADPGGEQISLALARVRHTVADDRYLGAILVNPGGPGGPGLAMTGIARAFPKKLRARFDWIGFDPRGVGASTPRITCDPGYQGFDRPAYVPSTRAIRTAWLDRSRRYAEDCARTNGAILEHMRTVDVADDMDAIRQALGLTTINYLGFSYGTYLGQVYATKYPANVGRMVLDSNVDPAQVFYRANLAQDVSMQQVMDRWYRWLGKRDRTYGLGGSGSAVARAYRSTRDALERRPAAGKIGSSEWTDIFNPVVYSESLWPRYGRLFSSYVRDGRAKPLVRAYRSLMGDDNLYAVYLAVQCTDAPWPVSWSTWSADNWRVDEDAPDVTWMNAWFNAPCRTWPAPSGPRVSVDGSLAPPILLAGGTYDGATPFADSLAVRRLFPSSSLVEIVGSASHANAPANACALRWITKYYRSGVLPERRTGDRADVRCPA